MQSEDGRNGLEGARRAESVAVHRLGGADANLVRVRAENLPDCPRLHRIVSERPCAVRIDISHSFWREACLAQSGSHGARWAVNRGLRQMMSVRCHAQAADFGVDFRAARLRSVEGL